jgi:hypothetical protein
MKQTTTLITTFVILSFFAAISMRAAVIWQDTFNYADGAIITNSIIGPGTNSVWVRHSGSANPSDAIVKNHRLENSFSGTGGRQDDVRRTFNSYTNGPAIPVYASFIVNCTSLPNGVGTYFAHFTTNSPTAGFCGRVYALVGTNLCQPGTYRLAISGMSTTAPNPQIYPVDLATNQDYQVVVGWDPASSWQATLWVNPISSSSYSTLSGDPATQPSTVCYLAFRQASSFGSWFATISNAVTATTFDEAATNVWATNAVPPSIVYQPTVGVTNYVGAAISLAAVATGQGLGDLTYRWQQNGVDRPGATANILNISSAATGDSGNYTLIVTTPYGLTATSSVAKVLISAVPVPPSFVTQPASQTVYKGQMVVLSTTVISPGNVTFTWYSNNVVATAGVNSSGGTSTMELDNVATNFSASYKVAVTNDVVVPGIVSSNAVLTVINPAAVSIAYLRTLVDPLNGYMPTNNLTIPYQVTGIITTYTNITTGNTFSYYLQDGTAGIDIFGTFGSTFRPQLGDVVTYVGVLSGYATGLELYADTVDLPFTSYTDLSNNIAALPAPIPVSFDVTANLDNMNYNIAGSLVKLSDVYFGTNAGTIITNHIITVTNSAGQKFQLQTFALDQDTLGQTFPVHAYSVSGVMYGMNTNFSLAVTRFADIVTTAPPPVTLNLGYAGGTLTFTWSDSSYVLQSSANVTGTYSTISGASSGFTTNTTSHSAMFYRLYRP